MLFIVILLSVSLVGSNIAWFFRNSDNVAHQRGFNRTIEGLERDLELARMVKPLCLCDHGINMHELGGKCNATVGEEELWLIKAVRDKTCKCKRYTGPEPLPEFYHPLELN